MKRLAYIAILCCLLLSSMQAQFVYLNVGAGFSVMKPQNNYTFTYVNDRMSWPGTFEEMTGQRADIGFSIASSLEFQVNAAPLRVTAGFVYTQLYGKSDLVKVPTPPWYSSLYTIGELTTRSNILTFTTGVRWQAIRSPIESYVSLDILYNILGDTKLSIRNASTITEAIVGGNTRMGLSFGVGVCVPLLPPIDVKIGGNYSLMNLITPDRQEEAKNLANLGVSLLYGLH